MVRAVLLSTLVICVSGSCASEPEPAAAPPPPATTERAPDVDGVAAPIAEAHGRDAWLAHPALAAHVEVDFGSDTILVGEMTFTTSMGRARIDVTDGPSVIWDGRTAWLAPDDAELPMARFHVLTWPYFALAPLKLRDPGTRLELLGTRETLGRSFETARLTFAEGVGDTPDDWYVLYKDPDTSRLHAMAYIVTFGTTAVEAEKEPHAIVYEEHAQLDGALVPTRMRFYMWTDDDGIHGDAIGELRLQNPRFVDPDPGTFEAPDSAREVALPSPGAE